MISDLLCHQCGGDLDNAGAESRGDGDLYDVLECPEHGRIYEVHAKFCECDCGGGRVEDVYEGGIVGFGDPFRDCTLIPWNCS